MGKKVGICSTCLYLFISAVSLQAAESRDKKAVEIAQNMMKAMGGEEAWTRARFLRFDFRVNAGGKSVVDRSHLWDKQTGRYRLDGKTKDGKSSVTLMNLANQQGTAYVDGKKLEGALAAQAMKDGYAAFINDVYWLAMPWKWMEPGVNLKYLGQRSRGGNRYEVVELSFNKVGLTPGDRYRAYVSPKTSMMEHWEYTLQSGQKGSWDWEYTTAGGIKLASNHKSEDGKSIGMGDVKILESVDDTVFTDPKKTLN